MNFRCRKSALTCFGTRSIHLADFMGMSAKWIRSIYPRVVAKYLLTVKASFPIVRNMKIASIPMAFLFQTSRVFNQLIKQPETASDIRS